MEISSALAQTIVADMKNIINQELNFIGTDGLVIASTDPKRINTYHEGAKRVISTKEDLIIEEDEQFKGTKKGINIPIYFENNIIGVIGITGEKKEVTKYGQIIKKMTEILIKEAWLKDLSIQRRENFRILIDYLLFNMEEGHANFSNMLEIDLMTPKNVIIGNMVKTNQSPYDFVNGMTIILEKFLSTNQQSIYSIKNDEIIIILDHSLENDLKYILQSILKEALEDFQVQLLFGVGLTTSNTVSIKQSYSQAQSVINWSKIFSNKSINYFNELDLGLIVNNVPLEDKQFYVKKVFSSLSEEEIKEFDQILKVYGENNGSITNSAGDLYIHKNTLQYKLNKLARLTGYNPRNMNDYVILKLAFMLNKTV